MLSSLMNISLSSLYLTSEQCWTLLTPLNHLLVTFMTSFLGFSSFFTWDLTSTLYLTSTCWSHLMLGARFCCSLILSSWMIIHSFMALILSVCHLFLGLYFSNVYPEFCSHICNCLFKISVWMSKVFLISQMQNGALHFHSPSLFLPKSSHFSNHYHHLSYLKKKPKSHA